MNGKMRMRWTLAFLLVLCCVSLLGSCGGSSGGGNAGSNRWNEMRWNLDNWGP